MLPPPSPRGPSPAQGPGRSSEAQKQSAGLVVLAVAIVTLLGLIALVWYVNEQESDDGEWPSLRSGPAARGLVIRPD
jgi:hypothetical protein